ncbi:MAG: hypothetical protein KatS3mg019_0814 [Fimbriimonadales bacterium]|nr:MAG: hypothetical protein KatS3mg019_0814 [Fimbriimonadales bacterium]
MQVITGASFRALWDALRPNLSAYSQILAPTGAARLLEAQSRQVSEWHTFLRNLTGILLVTRPTPEMTALVSELCESQLSDAHYFGKVRRYPQFHSALASSFCRWSADGLTPDLLEQGAALVLEHYAALAELEDADLQAEWRSKTGELVNLWRAWQAALCETGMPEPIRQWRTLLNALEAAEISQSLLLFGFTECTTLELQAMRILDSKTELTLALLYDSDCPERYTLTETLLNRLGIPVPTAPTDGASFAEHTHLHERECPRNLDASDLLAQSTDNAEQSVHITILDTPNPLYEVETIARAILPLLASGVAADEIVLLVRQPESQLETLEVVFARYGIPLQGEVNLPMERSWRVRWLMQGLKLLSGVGEGVDWLHWLAHPANRLPYEALAHLRQQIRKRIPAHRWLEQAIQNTADADTQHLLTELRALRQRLQNGQLPQVARALLQRLAQADASTSPDADLNEWLRLVNAYTNSWRNRMPAQAVELLERLVSDGRYTHKLGGQGVRLIPMEYADLTDARVAFAMGMLEGNLPKRCPDDPFLREAERNALNQALAPHGVWLPTRADAQAAEPMLFQRLLHAASEQLYLSYPRTQAGDSDALPSFYLEELKAQRSVETRFYRLDQIVPAESDCLHAYDLSLAHPVEYAEPPLALYAPALCQRIADTNRRFSVTELETLVRCPFQHFARYMLRLRPVQTDLSVLEVGSLTHAALCHAARQSQPQQTAQQWIEMLTQHLQTLLQRSAPDLPDWQLQVLHALAERLARRFGKREPDYQEQFGLRPFACEWAFGDTDADDEERTLTEPLHNQQAPREVRYRLANGAEIQLRGVIDRIDLSPDRNTVLVVDYKLGGAPSTSDFREGRAVQGMLYLHAVRTILPRANIALAYDRLKAGKRMRFIPHTLLQRFKRLPHEDSSDVSVFAPNQWQQAERALRTLLTQAITGLQHAEIQPRPDPKHCPRCPYADLCRKAMR